MPITAQFSNDVAATQEALVILENAKQGMVSDPSAGWEICRSAIAHLQASQRKMLTKGAR